MIKKFLAVLILFLSINMIYGQNGQLQISGQKKGANDSELQVNYVPGSVLQNGFTVELPANVKFSLIAVQAGETNLWLKNSPQKPTKENTIHWQKNINGLTLLFSSASIAAGTRLGIKLHISTPPNKDREASAPFIISSVRPAPDGTYVSGQEIVRQDLPKIQDN